MSRSGDNPESLAAQAADWVARLNGEAAGEEDWLAHEAWLSADPRHLAAYDEAERLWAEIGAHGVELAELVRPLATSAPIDFAARRRSRRPPAWAMGLGAAAAAAAVAIVVAGPNFFAAPFVDYRTAPGEVRKVALDDGTVIWMNGNSHLQVRMGRRSRDVRMDLAEASFDVAKNPARPFIIAAGADQVRVVGTEFDVNRSASSFSVTVRRGVVQVQPIDGSAEAVRLTPGWQLKRSSAAPRYAVGKSDPDAAFAWREGRLVYAEAPLSQIAADLSRRFPVPVTVDPSVADLKFTGVLSLDNPDAVIARLEAFLPITAHRTAQAITLSSR